jgi:hypothetical protein
MIKVEQDLEKMTLFEQWMLKVHFLRLIVAVGGLIATILAPFMVIFFGRITKVYLGW